MEELMVNTPRQSISNIAHIDVDKVVYDTNGKIIFHVLDLCIIYSFVKISLVCNKYCTPSRKQDIIRTILDSMKMVSQQ